MCPSVKSASSPGCQTCSSCQQGDDGQDAQNGQGGQDISIFIKAGQLADKGLSKGYKLDEVADFIEKKIPDLTGNDAKQIVKQAKANDSEDSDDSGSTSNTDDGSGGG